MINNTIQIFMLNLPIKESKFNLLITYKCLINLSKKSDYHILKIFIKFNKQDLTSKSDTKGKGISRVVFL